MSMHPLCPHIHWHARRLTPSGDLAAPGRERSVGAAVGVAARALRGPGAQRELRAARGAPLGAAAAALGAEGAGGGDAHEPRVEPAAGAERRELGGGQRVAGLAAEGATHVDDLQSDLQPELYYIDLYLYYRRVYIA